MADAWQTYTVQFNGGLITNISPLQQAINFPGSATRLINYEPSVEGGYRRIEGFKKFDDAEVTGTGNIRGITRFKGNTYAARGNYLYKSTGNGWTVVNASIPFNGSGIVKFASYNFDGTEKLIICDGGSTNKPFGYDGTTFTSLSNLSSDLQGASDVIIFKNQVFFVDENQLFFGAPYEDVYDNAVGVLGSAQGGGVINIGADITDVIVFRDQLIIFTERSIKRLSGNTVADFRLDPISEDLGASVSGTVQEVGGDIMFLGPDGLRTLAATDRIGDFNLGSISRNVQKEITNLLLNSISFSSTVIRNKSQYRLFGFNSGFQNLNALGILGTQYASQGAEGMAWAETRGINAYVTHSSQENNDEYILFGNSDGYVYQLERGNSFDGANIECQFESPSFVFEDPRVRKTFYKIHLYTDPTGSVDVTTNLLLDNPTVGRETIQPTALQFSNTTSGVFIYGANNVNFAHGALVNDSAPAIDAGSTSFNIDNMSFDGSDPIGVQIGDSFFVDEAGHTTEYVLTTYNLQGGNITGTAPTASSTALTFTPGLSQSISDNTHIRFVTDRTATYGSGTFEEVFEGQLIGSGFSAGVRLTGDNTNPPYSLDTMTIEYIVNSRR